MKRKNQKIKINGATFFDSPKNRIFTIPQKKKKQNKEMTIQNININKNTNFNKQTTKTLKLKGRALGDRNDIIGEIDNDIAKNLDERFNLI